MDAVFYDSLYEGDSAAGLKLCMGLAGGDFWSRPAGCCVLYRGGRWYEADFDRPIAVADAEADAIGTGDSEIGTGDESVFVLRRVNGCGQLERSLRASRRVIIDAVGQLVRAGCNRILSLSARQSGENRVELVWFYSPAEQEAQCEGFAIYRDNGSGQVSFEQEIGRVSYRGNRIYRFIYETEGAGRYCFCVSAQCGKAADESPRAYVSVEARPAEMIDDIFVRAEAV